MNSSGVPFSKRTGIRNRVHRFSDSVLRILTSASSVTEKYRAIPSRTSTILVSRTIVFLTLLSIACLFLSIFIEVFIQLRPAGLKLTRRIAHDLNFTQASKYLSSSSTSQLSIDDYRLVLVNESNPFHAAPHSQINPIDDQDEQALAEQADEGMYTTVSTTDSENEVYRRVATGNSNVRTKNKGKYDEGLNTDEVSPAARLIVLTMNRANSLERLLQSLEDASYGTDTVDLDIWIDRKKGADKIDEKILNVSRNISWRQGTKTIHKRKANAGLYQQWIYTWNLTDPSSPNEFAVILEDDLQVSPQFYKWLLLARAAYADDEEVSSFTLQRPTLRPRQRKGIASGPLNISMNHAVFKYRLLGTWGFAPLREHWIEFRKWFELARVRGDKPYVDNLMTTNWYKSQEKDGFAPNMWSQWWIRFVDQKNYFTVTPNLPDGSTLAANWREPGLHFSSEKEPKADFSIFKGDGDQFVMPDNPVLVDWDGLIIPNREARSM